MCIRDRDELFVPIKQINDVPDRETLLLMTGSQGEPLAALSRISRGEHPQVKVKTTDTIIFRPARSLETRFPWSTPSTS